MAVDEVLLQSAADGIATFRTYAWDEPTLSLGYFQAYTARADHPPSMQCAVVRRHTGGGAIVHDQELTYALALPWAGPHVRLYDLVHRALLAILADYGVFARMLPAAEAPSSGVEPFLCFQRHAERDVLLGGDKIAGSAQRRRRGAVLQHGSILLSKSSAAPELPGLQDLALAAPRAQELAGRLTQAISVGLGVQPRLEALAPAERQAVQACMLEKYFLESWTQKR